MEKQMFGEFLGTLVLILLGNGVVASVLLSKSKAEGAGWMVIATGWAFAVMAGVFTAVACGAPGHLNPAVTLASAISSGDFSNVAAVLDRAASGRIRRRGAGVGSFRPALARNPDADAEARLLLHVARDPQLPANLLSEFDRHVCADSGGQRHRIESGSADGTGARAFAVPDRLLGLGHRTESGWHDGLCD